MKRSTFLAPLTALAVSFSVLAPVGAAEKTKPSQAIADSPRTALATRISVVSPADLAATYGFVAKLPKDVEAFSASYHLRDLVTGIASSKWADTLMSLPPIKGDRDIQRMVTQFQSPEVQQVLGVVDAIVGQEFVVAMPAGFADKTKPLFDAYMDFVGVYIQNAVMAGMGGKSMGPRELDQMMKNAAPDLIPAFAKAEVPPVLLVAKAGKAKAMIDGAMAQVLQQVGGGLPPAFEAGEFKVDAYDFKSISVTAKKLIGPAQEEQLKTKLKELLEDDAKVKAVYAQIQTKRAEVAWGWVGEYFVLSIGSDHSHVKLAATAADSALSIPDVNAPAGEFAAKKPLSLAYASRTLFDKFATKIEFSDAFTGITEELRGILKPDAIDGMRADVKKLEARAQTLFTPVFDSQVQVSWLEAGIHADSIGGQRDTMLDSSKPLGFSSLFGPTTFLFADSRSSVNTKLAVDFLEDGAATLWSWYQKYGATMVPESERQGAQMIESVGLPLLKQAWGSLRSLGKALGSEGAFVLDLNGQMPTLPDVPAFAASGKIPRLAYVAELKDRAALSESWKGFASIIKQVAALADTGANIPEPQSMTEGGLEMFYVPLPVKTGDLLPHVAISKDRWILSTSPSFSKELAATPAAAGAPLGGLFEMNFTALWDLADKWLAVADKNSEAMFGAGDARQFKAIRPLIDTAVQLARSVQGLEVKVSEEGGKAHSSVYLKLQDLK